jgi:hypothetical protein
LPRFFFGPYPFSSDDPHVSNESVAQVEKPALRGLPAHFARLVSQQWPERRDDGNESGTGI